MSPISSAMLKVAISSAAIALVLLRTRQLPRAEMGYVRPPIGPALLFLAIYLAWMFGTDAALHWRGPWDFAPWRAAPLPASILRVLAVCVLGPVAEELIFRGWLFGMARKRFGVPLAVAATSLGWAALHYGYDWQVIAVIVVDGLLLGFARWRTGSIAPPILMHMAYNLYAIW